MRENLFVGIRDDFDMEEAKIGRILSHPDLSHIDGFMRRNTYGAHEWRLYSVYIEASPESKNQIINWLDVHSTHVIIGGAWKWNGLQVGTSRDDEGDIIGTPLYAIHSKLLDFMPDGATNLNRANKISGQSDRLYS